MHQETDEAIAEAVQRGDGDAFGILIDRYEPKLTRYGWRFLNTKEDIEDMVHEVFIKAYINIQSFDSSKRFSPWIYRIAHNEFVNALRSFKRRPMAFLDPDTILPQLAGNEAADKAILDAELKEQIESSLDTLDSKYREPLVLYFYEEMSYQDISEVLRIPVTTVGVRINRAKEKLKAAYNENLI